MLQAFGFLLAGYETTASALAFTIYNLSANPDKAARLMQASSLPFILFQ
jgi:cytochrome P450